MKRATSIFNFLATVLFFAAVIITYMYPNLLEQWKITPVEARTIIMNLISLILLIYFLQTHLKLSWRIFCLIGSFIVLIESILMLGAWKQLINF
ncbi:MAG: hypothetical protein ACLFQV_07830 [Vulcanimicrobiota bacterium]